MSTIHLQVSLRILVEGGKMRYNRRMGDNVVSLCKAHGKLGSMTFAFDLMYFGQI